MDGYIAERNRLIETGAPGLGSARRLALLTDDLLRKLAAESDRAPKGPWSLLALGGYGAGALLPCSDIDVLLVSGASASEVKPFVESLLYPLWDSGLVVGHQVRSPKAHFAAGRRDEMVLTSSLTGRVVAGNIAYGEALLSRCCTDAHKRAKRVLADLGRRARPGSPYLLEPDLKEGAGGRRDYDELVWMSAVLSASTQNTPRTLVETGVLREWELELAETAAAVVVAARWRLAVRNLGQRMSPDAADVLGVDAQAVQGALADTAHVLDRARRRQAGGTDPRAGRESNSEPLSAGEVLDLVRLGDDGVAPLQEAAWDGRLDALIPGYRSLLALRRPGLTHTLTVGAHSIRCATVAATLPAEEGSVLRQSRATIGDDRPLLVAALAHDRGKSRPGPGHAERGALIASECAWVFGLGEEQRRDVADLVRLHLVLAESATHDDLDSEETILRVAERIARRELVAPLHVLTVADSIATGSAAWGPWQEALVGTLVSRVDAALSPEVDGVGLAKRAEKVRSAALAGLPPETPVRSSGSLLKRRSATWRRENPMP